MHEIVMCDAEQGTDKWLEDRLGKLTGSVCHPVFVASKNGFGEGAKTLAREICAERLTGRSISGTLCVDRESGDFVRKNIETGAMAWGKYHEDASRDLFNLQNNLSIAPIGFAYIKGLMVGCSLDGFQDRDGYRIGFEMKHYETKNCLELIEKPESFWASEKGVLTKEASQCIFNAWVMNLDEIHLVCRDPRLPSPLSEYFVKITKKGDELKELVSGYEKTAKEFLELVDKTYESFENIGLKILGLD